MSAPPEWSAPSWVVTAEPLVAYAARKSVRLASLLRTAVDNRFLVVTSINALVEAYAATYPADRYLLDALATGEFASVLYVAPLDDVPSAREVGIAAHHPAGVDAANAHAASLAREYDAAVLGGTPELRALLGDDWPTY
ncbi:MAG TPA: hypothetical protein VGR21_04810 [Cryptosporangiaceae bacterium]|nr:hypothetical protein [Cryptosporangiaceae bacterium]